MTTHCTQIRVLLRAKTKARLKQKIKDYLADYHPAGYGTRVDKKYFRQGMYHAELTRWNSCD